MKNLANNYRYVYRYNYSTRRYANRFYSLAKN